MDIYRRNFLVLCLNFYIISQLTINLNTRVYIDKTKLYSMENKETNPTIVVGNDDKKEEPKKDDSAKSDK